MQFDILPDSHCQFTIAVFLYNQQVEWKYGLILAIGSVTGAFIASRLAVSKGVDFVKWVIIVVILLTAGDMFGLYDVKTLFASILNK